jgi:DNA-binding NtrC family response regulator
VNVARSTLPLLLLGETGTGKEVLAQAVHTLSGRTGPLVAVNCGAIPGDTPRGELFGHVRGVFSGAVRNEIGLVRAADHGTLFLDEIGDLPASSQAALLCGSFRKARFSRSSRRVRSRFRSVRWQRRTVRLASVQPPANFGVTSMRA